jgi:hypothetical protein
MTQQGAENPIQIVFIEAGGDQQTLAGNIEI